MEWMEWRSENENYGMKIREWNMMNRICSS